MRFCDFFIDYKIGLKNIKSSIPFIQLPLYRKIAIVIIFVITTIGCILIVTQHFIATLILYLIAAVLFIPFLLIASTQKSLKQMLNNYYKPHSQERMQMMIAVLSKYNIQTTDTDVINMLIEEAKNAQIQSDYLLPLKKPFKTLCAIVFPIIVYVAKKYGDIASKDELLTAALAFIIIAICIFAMIMAIIPPLKELCYRDYYKYNELISDLTQIKIFYSSK